MPTCTPEARYDVLVVGAGPAGLAAATAAAGAGRCVAVVDSGQTPGGQYWRHSPGAPAGAADLQHDQRTFRMLTAKLRSRASHLPGHDVWAVASDHDGFTVHALHNDDETTVRGRALVLAPGAYDRQLPFPGWELPGVYTAGGAQALMKGHGVRVGTRVVVGGTGPFLLPVAAGLARHGVDVRGVFDANHPIAWARHAPAAIRNVGKIAEGSRYAATLARHRVRVRAGHAIVAAHGDAHVEAVTVVRLTRNWQVIPGSSRIVVCDAVAVGWGFTPRLELPLALGCASRVDADGSLVVVVDEHQATDIPGVFAAGEVCGVGGAALAVVEGQIAGHAAATYPTVSYARRPGRRAVGDSDAIHGADGHRNPPPGAPAKYPMRSEELRGVDWESSAGEEGITIPHRTPHKRKRERLRTFAAAMHDIYPVHEGWQRWLRPDTVVCRCEEVPLAGITEAVHELGATDARTVKLFSRAGMGWCQGRTCGFAVSCLTAAESGAATDLRGLAERPVATPIPVGLLARRSTPPADQADLPDMADHHERKTNDDQ